MAEQVVTVACRVNGAGVTLTGHPLSRLLDLLRERQSEPGAARAYVEAARSLLRLGRRPDVARRALDAIRSPVLVLHGRRDRLVPAAFAEATLARYPAWRGRIFPDLGHVPQMEDPGRWLTEVGGWLSEDRTDA